MSIAREGDRVTDEHGKTVCYVSRDINAGDVVSLGAFHKWEESAPELWTALDRRYIKIRPDGRTAIRVDGQWKVS